MRKSVVISLLFLLSKSTICISGYQTEGDWTVSIPNSDVSVDASDDPVDPEANHILEVDEVGAGEGEDKIYSFPDSTESIQFDQMIKEPIWSSEDKHQNHSLLLMEGDIAVHLKDNPNLTVADIMLSNGNETGPLARYAINNNYRLWPSARIPYVIDSSLGGNRNLIQKCMNHISAKTCVRFVPRNSEKDYVRIYRGPNRSCYSMIGRLGGSQGLSLGNGCLHHGVVVHELMHSVGFYHMHSRSDRDAYLKVLWQNIRSDMQSQFRRNNRGADKIFGPFDYSSIMLYGSKLFSANGRDTMIPMKKGVYLKDTAVKFGLSDEDAGSINQLYGCPNIKGGKPRGKKPQVPEETTEKPKKSTPAEETTPAPKPKKPTKTPIRPRFTPKKIPRRFKPTKPSRMPTRRPYAPSSTTTPKIERESTTRAEREWTRITSRQPKPTKAGRRPMFNPRFNPDGARGITRGEANTYFYKVLGSRLNDSTTTTSNNNSSNDVFS